MKTARQRTIALTRAMRPTRRRHRDPSQLGVPTGAAMQIFLSRVDVFLGTELFGAERPVTIGRHIDAVLRLDDDTVSRLHCRLIFEGNDLYLEDLASANGTLLNRHRIEGRVKVSPADAIHVGAYTLKVRALVPRELRVVPTDEMSDKSTRRAAILHADSSRGTEDAAVDFGTSVNWKLYEAAVRRATGAERPEDPVALRVVADRPLRGPTPTRPMDDAGGDEIVERERTVQDTIADDVLEQPEVQAREASSLDPWIDERIAQLDRIVDKIERPDRDGLITSAERCRDPLPPPVTLSEEVFLDVDDDTPPKIVSDVARMGPQTFARYLATQLSTSAGGSSEIDDRPQRSVRRSFSVVPTESMRDEDSTEAELDGPPLAAGASPLVEVEIEIEPPKVVARRVPMGSDITVPPAIDPAQFDLLDEPRTARDAPRPVTRARVIRTPSAADVPLPPPLPHMRKPARSTIAPALPRSVTEVRPRSKIEDSHAAPLTARPIRAKLQDADPPKLRQVQGRSSIAAPSSKLRLPTRALPPTPTPVRPAMRRVDAVSKARPSIGGQPSSASVRGTTGKGIAERVRQTLEAPASSLPIRGASAGAIARRLAELDAEQTPRARPVVMRTPLPELVLTPAAQPRLRSVRIRQPIPARLVTPTAMRISVGPLAPGAKMDEGVRPSQIGKAANIETELVRPRRPSEDAWVEVDSEEIVRSASSIEVPFLDDDDYTESIDEASVAADFDAVEVAARAGSRLLDIATLRRDGDQYVLGHKTPQGVEAPHIAHVGLRLLRIGPGRTVDLVFPGDAAGHLVRDGDTVMFNELAQGRKYSCIRLTAGDVATVMLNDSTESIAYHVRFLRRPRL